MKKLKKKLTTKCPNCGKVLPIRFLNEVVFCDKICKTNFTYRKAHKDIMGKIPSAKETRTWKK